MFYTKHILKNTFQQSNTLEIQNYQSVNQLTMPTINNSIKYKVPFFQLIPSQLQSLIHKSQRLFQLEGKEGALHESAFEIWVDIVTTTVLPNNTGGFLFISTIHRKKELTISQSLFGKKCNQRLKGDTWNI